MVSVQSVTEKIDGIEYIRGKDGRIFVLRECSLKDIQQVVYINRAVLPENYPEFFFVDHQVNYPKGFIVAEIDGRVVGYVMSRVEYGWSYFSKDSVTRKGHIISIGVLPFARRIGIGYNMLLRALRALKYHYNATEAYLEVRVSNVSAISLYKKLKFEILDVIRRYYHDGEDAYVMGRRLGDL